MDEKDPRSSVRRAGDPPRQTSIGTTTNAAASRPPTTLWRKRSATYDNQASCSVSEGPKGFEVVVIFAKGLAVPEHFSDVAAAVHHSMEIAGRLTAQGWVDIDLPDE